MNQEWLKIYKKYRQRKYERDHDKLLNDLANRGLALLSIRNNEERWLKEDYDDDIAMKREEVEIEIEKSKERRTSIRTNRILVVFAIISFFVTLGVSFFTIQYSKEANELSKRSILLSSSPKYSEALSFSVFKSDLRIRNESRVSLHNVQPQFIEIYENPSVIQLFGGMETMIYDIQSGQSGIVTIPGKFKIKGKTILVQICYLFNDDPFDIIDDSISPWKLKDDPFYESTRRFQAYRNYRCSSTFIKYEEAEHPAII